VPHIKTELGNRRISEPGQESPNPTNERKKMSKKTLRKRIALIAVSAVGFGLLSSVSANAADVAYTSGTTGGIGALTGAYCAAVDASGAAATATAASVGSLNITMPVGSTIQVKISKSGDYVKVTAPLAITAAGTMADIVAGSGGTKALASADAETINITGTAVGDASLYQYGTDSTYTTALSTVSISVVSTCGNSTWSNAYSNVKINTNGATAANNIDAATSAAVGNALYVSFVGRNAYNSILPSGTWKASATNGALVNFGSVAVGGASASITKGTVSTVTLSSTDGDGANNTGIAVRVNPAKTATGGTTTVTLYYNDAVVATKTMTFIGDEAKLVISSVTVGANGGTGTIKYYVYDAAGNQTAATPTLDPLTASPRTGSITVTTEATSTAQGVATFPCSTTSGSTTTALQFYSSYAAALVSTPVTLVCGGSLNTYSVAMDKSSYKIGEVATLTITAKDSAGMAVADSTKFDSNLGAAVASAVAVPGTTAAQTPLNGDTFTSGKLVYRFSVTTAGSWNASVYSSSAATTTTAQTAAYTVTGGDASMSEVLAAIVKLIASINKQIAALQKSLKK